MIETATSSNVNLTCTNDVKMLIMVVYRDAPELSPARRRASGPDPAAEGTLLLNPDCPVRVMLEYIRKSCKLGVFTQFELCTESGALMGLFGLPTFACAAHLFQHKGTYYIIVIRREAGDKSVSVLPQLSHDNRLYEELAERVRRFISTGECSPPPPLPPPPPGKLAPKKK